MEIARRQCVRWPCPRQLAARFDAAVQPTSARSQAGQGSRGRSTPATAGRRCGNPPSSAVQGGRDREQEHSSAVACARAGRRRLEASAGSSCVPRQAERRRVKWIHLPRAAVRLTRSAHAAGQRIPGCAWLPHSVWGCPARQPVLSRARWRLARWPVWPHVGQRRVGSQPRCGAHRRGCAADASDPQPGPHPARPAARRLHKRRPGRARQSRRLDAGAASLPACQSVGLAVGQKGEPQQRVCAGRHSQPFGQAHAGFAAHHQPKMAL